MSFIQKIGLAMLLAALNTVAWASLTVSPLKINFLAGQQGYQDIFLQNKGEKGLYVEVTPTRILHAGTPRRVVESYDLDNPYRFGLAISRLYTYVPANGHRMIRIVPLLGQLKTDAVYSIKIVPLPGKPKSIAKRAKIVVTHMRVLVGYDVLLFIRPKDAAPRIAFSQQGHHLTVTNKGNTNALLYKGRQCDAKGTCIKLPSKRLYAGNQWSINLTYRTPVSFEQRWAGHHQKIRSDA